MDIQEIFSVHLQKLPYTTKFKLISNAKVLLYVAASVSARNAAGLIGVNEDRRHRARRFGRLRE